MEELLPLVLQILHRKMHRITHRMQVGCRISGKHEMVFPLVLEVSTILLHRRWCRILHLVEVVHHRMHSSSQSNKQTVAVG